MKLLLLCALCAVLSAALAKNYYIQNTTLLNWFAAYQNCELQGLQLATVTTANEQLTLEKAINQSNIADEGLWLGGTDLAKEGSYIWMPSGEPFVYQNWLPYQPDNHNNSEHCMHVYPASRNTFEWNDGPCDHVKYFVCEEQPKNCYKNEDIVVVCEIMQSRK